MASDSLPPIILEDVFEQQRWIGWRVEEARPDPANPLLEGEMPWDDATPAVGHGTLLKDPIDGKFKGWTPVMSNDTPEKQGECEFRLAYIESDDGVKWRRPKLGLCSWDGHGDTNLIFDNDSGGRTTYASVMIDPEANPNEPYEMFCFREPQWRCPQRRVAGFNQEPAKDAIDVWKYYGLYRYRSKDGIRWRAIEGPIKMQTGDSCYIFRDAAGGYVAHHKSAFPAGPGNVIPRYECAPNVVRVTHRRTSADGTNWSNAVPLVWPDRYDNASDQIMEVGRFPYASGFLGLVTMYNALSQRMNVQFSASANGEQFWRPIPRTPALSNPPLGEFGGGMIWPFRLPIAHNGRLYIYYGALAGLHGDVYSNTSDMRMFRNGALCRASWEMGRFFAAVNSDAGGVAQLTTRPLSVTGRRLQLNAATVRNGSLLVELLDAENQPIGGFGKEDFTAFRGDEKFADCHWRGGDRPEQAQVKLRFDLQDARLYGFSWQ